MFLGRFVENFNTNTKMYYLWEGRLWKDGNNFVDLIKLMGLLITGSRNVVTRPKWITPLNRASSSLKNMLESSFKREQSWRN